MMKKWKVAFWTPGNMPECEDNTFGCASYGFCTDSKWVNPDVPSTVIWDIQPKGMVFSGKYSEVLHKLSALDTKPKAAIAVFSKAFGMEEFIDGCRNIFGNIPMIGGGAARNSNQQVGEILPAAEDVAILLIYDDGFIVKSKNVHKDTGTKVHVEKASPRLIEKIRLADDTVWKDAVIFFKEQQALRDVPEEDFETITFSDLKGRNIHCSLEGNYLKSGANLPDDDVLTIRLTSREDTLNAIESFISEENTLVFGCAGLRSLLDKQVFARKNSIVGFMFGELLTLDNKEAVFGNLMLAKLIYVNQN